MQSIKTARRLSLERMAARVVVSSLLLPSNELLSIFTGMRGQDAIAKPLKGS